MSEQKKATTTEKNGDKDNSPNLFDYATSELSQDALIAWLLAWANPDPELRLNEKDLSLHECGKKLITALFRKHDKLVPEDIESIDVKRQYKKIDVLCIINRKGQAGNREKFVILVEDKVGTRQHSNQLKRYKESASKEGYDENKTILIYLQTGDQASYEIVEKEGYKPFLRADFIEVLGSYKGTNTILLNYRNYLNRIENEVQAYKTKPLADWGYRQWIGFYIQLQRELEQGGWWRYIPNPKGGFWGFWWSYHDIADEEGATLYLLLQQGRQGRLCFKIEPGKSKNRRQLGEAWQERILEESKSGEFQQLNVKRARFRVAKAMTLCECVEHRVPREKEGEEVINVDQTVEKLRLAVRFLDTVVKKHMNNRSQS